MRRPHGLRRCKSCLADHPSQSIQDTPRQRGPRLVSECRRVQAPHPDPFFYAVVAKLADAQRRGRCGRKALRVQIPPSAPIYQCPSGGTADTAVLEAAAEKHESANLSLGTNFKGNAFIQWALRMQIPPFEPIYQRPSGGIADTAVSKAVAERRESATLSLGTNFSCGYKPTLPANAPVVE